ncbi:hypothetical protein EDD11_004330 [Mortierella claussenii]|nr:hypothetical protein EDD11_004330 [Mortierella claussenii]
MPLLIHAVPLSKNWLGVHYWGAPKQEGLPEELEYISYDEFQDRFQQLDRIARPVYPTFWPNVAIVLLLAGVAAAATIGIMHTGTNLAIMGQGACFLLPVIIVVWVKFKHQSQKLLRAWTAVDADSHAIQWKLRLRSKSVAKRWQGSRSRRRRINYVSNSPGDHFVVRITHNEADHQEGQRPQQQQRQLERYGQHNQHQQHYAGTFVAAMQSAQTHGFNGPVVASVAPQMIDIPNVPAATAVEQNGELLGTPIPAAAATATTSSSPATFLSPPSLASVYDALRTTHLHSVTRRSYLDDASPLSTAALPDVPGPVTVPHSIVHTAPVTATDLAARAETISTSAGEEDFRVSIWASISDRVRNSMCLAYFFRERKVWMIEISLRDCQLDEYALTVPSPVYCDYRLPGYEDIMTPLTPARPIGTAVTATTSANSSRVRLNRYQGEPPAYESDTDGGESEDDDEDGTERWEDEDQEQRDTERTGGVRTIVIGTTPLNITSRDLPNRLVAQGGAPGDGGEESSSGLQHCPQEMTMVQRPVEMTSIMVLSSSSSSSPLAERALTGLVSSDFPFRSMRGCSEEGSENKKTTSITTTPEMIQEQDEAFSATPLPLSTPEKPI